MTKFTKVVPSILTYDPVALETMIRQAESFTTCVQMDIMDGQFVPSRSITNEHLSSPHEVISLARELDLEVGLAVNPETPVSVILPLVDKVDSVLLLTVNPGFYGSKFIPEVMDKVAELRKARPEMEIGVDGGVKENNITQIAQTGVDVIYVGSAIFLHPQPGESFRHLLALAQEN